MHMHAHTCTYSPPHTEQAGKQRQCVSLLRLEMIYLSPERLHHRHKLHYHSMPLTCGEELSHCMAWAIDYSLKIQIPASPIHCEGEWCVMCAVCVCVSVDVCLKQKLSSLAIGPKANWYTARSAHRNHTTYTQPTDEDMHQISHSIGPVCLYCGHTLHSWKRWGVLATSWLHY